MNLFINYYIDPNPERQKEIDTCLQLNLDTDNIERVYIFAVSKTPPYDYKFKNTLKIIPIPFDRRPTFKDFFAAVNQVSGKDDINVIVNSDIYLGTDFDASMIKADQCFALTRWDSIPATETTKAADIFYNNSGSQDTWVFRGPIKQVKGGDYTQGVAGADNKIAWELEQAGYKVSNPSLTIKTYHLHNSGVRYYDKVKPGEKDIYRLPHPRKNVQISRL